MDDIVKNDQNALNDSGFNGRMGFGNRPAFVVVDFSVGFTGGDCRIGFKMTKELEQTNRILAVMREKKLPVIFTSIGYNKNLKDAGAWLYKWSTAGDFTKPENVAIDHSLNYDPETENLIIKKGASSFFETNLNSLLRTMNVDTVIIAGCTTSGCVRATAVDAMQCGFRTIVAGDAVADRAERSHEVSLFDLQNKYADVLSTEEILVELGKY